MNKAVSTQQVSDVKKVSPTQQIASECHLKCWEQGTSEACLEQCYDQVLATFNGCLTALKETGHSRNSRYIRLIFGQMEDPYRRIERFNDMLPTIHGYVNFYEERDYFDPSRST